MDPIKALAVVICFGIAAFTIKYTVDNVKLHPTTAADVEVAKVKAERDERMQRLSNDHNSRDSNETITNRRLKCILEIKNALGADHPSFNAMVDSTCK